MCLGGGRCWALGAPHSCSLGRVRPLALVSTLQLLHHLPELEPPGWAGPVPHPQLPWGGGGGEEGRWAALPESQWWPCRDPACPHLPPPSPCASRAPPGAWGGTPLPLALRWPEQQRWPLARLVALGSPSCGPCPSLPAGISAGEGGQAGTATQWWGIKGRKGRRKKNTPQHRQLTELAPGWGRVGTAAGLACQPGTGRATGGGHPFSAPVTHPYGQEKPVGATTIPCSAPGGEPPPRCLCHS